MREKGFAASEGCVEVRTVYARGGVGIRMPDWRLVGRSKVGPAVRPEKK